MSTININKMAKAAMVAALYTAVSLLLAPFSFGSVQVRIAEALCLLPVCMPASIPGLALGCALTNAVGFAMGANLLGFADVVFGTAATLAAALLTRALRNVRFHGLPLASAAAPVVLNAVVVGAELTVLLVGGGFSLSVFFMQAALVGAGEAVACFLAGLALISAIEKNPALMRFFSR